jgi:hypothetical protein
MTMKPVVINEGIIKKGGLNPPAPPTYRPPAPTPLKPPSQSPPGQSSPPQAPRR